VEIGDREAEAGGGLEAARGGMHSDCGGCEGVVGRENQGAPILTIVIGCVWGAGEDIMPSVRRLAGKREGEEGSGRRTRGCWTRKGGQ
jgi:hypothetical protein